MKHSKRRKAGTQELRVLTNGKLAEIPGHLLMEYSSKASTIQRVCMMALVCKEWRFIKCAAAPCSSFVALVSQWSVANSLPSAATYTTSGSTTSSRCGTGGTGPQR